MKKLLLSFAEDILSREQMRIIKGGYESMGGASARCSDNTTKTCHGTSCISADDSPTRVGFCECITGDPQNGGFIDSKICG